MSRVFHSLLIPIYQVRRLLVVNCAYAFSILITELLNISHEYLSYTETGIHYIMSTFDQTIIRKVK